MEGVFYETLDQWYHILETFKLGKHLCENI